jgi:RNA recognition motif-containing protein
VVPSGQSVIYSPGAPTEFSEIENRSILITNVGSDVSEQEIEGVFGPTEEIRNIDWSNRPCGAVTIEYYNLRNAQNLKKGMNGGRLGGNIIAVSYAPLAKIDDPKKPPNNGTIVVFHLPQGVSSSDIEATFGQFGEIRQIRGTPTKPTQRFIEFWDIRAAERALNGFSGKYLLGSRVSIEFSLPGGFRRAVQRTDPPSGFVRPT